MLEEQDLQQIGEVVKKEIKSEMAAVLKAEVPAIVRAEVPAIIRAEVPAMIKAELDVAEKRIIANVVKEVVDSVSELTENLEKHLINTLADKASVNKMIDASVERDQRLNQKIDTMTGFLSQKKVLENPEVSQIQSIKVFGPLLRGQG